MTGTPFYIYIFLFKSQSNPLKHHFIALAPLTNPFNFCLHHSYTLRPQIP